MLTDEDVQDQQKEQDKEQHDPQHKKRKADKTTNTINLAEEDIGLLVDEVSKVAQTIFKGICKEHK